MRKKEEKKVISVNLFKKRKEESLFSNEWAIKVTAQISRRRNKNTEIKSYILAHAGLEPATFALLARRSNQLS